MKKLLPILNLVLIILCLAVQNVYAFKATSTSYKLEGEFTNFGGSSSSSSFRVTNSSSNYAGFSYSAGLESCTGFQCVGAKVPTISMTINGGGTVTLGALSDASVSSQSHTISVSTVLSYGYQVRVVDDGNLRDGAKDIDDASGDNDVDAGSEEYGLATSKTGQQIIDWDGACNGSNPEKAAAITTTPQSVASAAVDVTNDSTTLCYSASRSGNTPAGSYQHTLTYIATGTF